MATSQATDGQAGHMVRRASAWQHLSATGVAIGLFGCVSAAALFGASSTVPALCATALTLVGCGLIARRSGEVEAVQATQDVQQQLLLESVSDLITWHDKDGLVSECAGAGIASLGLTGEMLVGRGLFDRVHVADRPVYLKALSDAAHGNETVQVAFRVRGDETRGFRWFDMRARQVSATANVAGAAKVVAVLRD
jgi:two-component system, cell cycle sensor histidine kinase DivJ